MRVRAHLEYCIANSDSQAATAHWRQVGEIISNVRNVIIGKVAGKLYLIINCEFIADTLMKMLDAEFLCAMNERGGAAAGDDAEFEARQSRQAESLAVVDMKYLERFRDLGSVKRVIEPAISQNAVAIHQYHADCGGALLNRFRNHLFHVEDGHFTEQGFAVIAIENIDGASRIILSFDLDFQ